MLFGCVTMRVHLSQMSHYTHLGIEKNISFDCTEEGATPDLVSRETQVRIHRLLLESPDPRSRFDVLMRSMTTALRADTKCTRVARLYMSAVSVPPDVSPYFVPNLPPLFHSSLSRDVTEKLFGRSFEVLFSNLSHLHPKPTAASTTEATLCAVRQA